MGKNVVLVGPMGAGKSTIGRQLSARLGYEFLDTDHMIEARTGADIPWIFDVEGEAGFREREAAVLADIVGGENSVVATGGGIVMREGNRSLLKQLGHVIYLCASIEQLIKRTQKDRKRPLLQVENPQEKIRALAAMRDPIYREVADTVIVTDGCSAKTVLQKISESLSLSI